MRALEQLAEWPVGVAAAGVVALEDDGRPAVAAVAGPTSHLLPWASITKLCTALAVLVAVEERSVFLEEAAGPPGSTVAHLLSHASGLGPTSTRPLSPPGQRRIYSNVGYELLARLVAARAQMPFERYLREAVLEPLGMAGAQLAAGASPAWGLWGTLDDLLAMASGLLRPRVVAAETLARATAVWFPGLAGVLPGFGHQDPCDWGLGFELRDAKAPHWTGRHNSARTYGHFGQRAGFLWVDPAAKVGCAALSDGAFGSWAAAQWPRLADAVLAELAPASPMMR
jgi:CubicO group peptidase (beta-lactamase class C family)